MTQGHGTLFKTARFLHLLGLAMFLGSIFAFVVIGAIPVPPADVETVYHYRRAIRVMTWVLTVPGMWLMTATGIVMAVLGRYGLFRVRWLTLKQLAMLVILANGTFVLVPHGEELFMLATRALAQGELPEGFAALGTHEDIAGTVNLLLILGALALAVWRPFSGKRKAGVPQGG
jgi:hypothetical protein